MICDNVSTAVSVSNSDNISQFVRNTDSDQVSDVALLTDSATGGKYVILSNGLSNARYSIESLKWESTTGQMGDNGSANFTSMATEGALSIVEPKGLKFLNEVQNSYKLLNSDPTACVWMIKTIFVGYNDHLTPLNSDYITNIRPLIFVVVDLTADFTVEGGFYNISFVNINNGAGKLPQTMKSAETIKMNLGSKTTLREAIEGSLSKKINDNSSRHFNAVKKTVEESGMTPKEVTYKFVLADAYDTNYVVDDSQQQNKTDGTQEAGCHLDFSKAITVENAIKLIMKHCSKVKKDVKGDSNGEKFGFKIRSILNSNKDKHEMIYYIDRYKMVFSDIFEAAGSTDQATKQAVAENTIEFDYIYTGNNTDILDFSMKMELGIVFFQTIISSNNLSTQTELQGGNVAVTAQTGQGVPENAKNIATDKPKKPILPVFFSTTTKNLENSNFKNPKESTEFQTLLNRHVAIENLNAKMKIHGNPTLLNSVNKVPGSYDKISKVISNDVDGAPAFPHWESVPALAKVNIFMPTTDANGQLGREKFWYDGLYLVLTVANEFAGGLFTQELTMVSIPNSISDAADKTYSKDKTTNQPIKKISTISAATAKPINTSKIKNFEEIKALAEEVGAQEGVDPNLILGIIKQESAFDPNAGSSAGAQGLMQLIPSTAEEMGIPREDLFIPKQNMIAGARYIKKQLQTNDGDLTLALAAYNAGPGNVRKYGGVPPFKETEHYVVVVQENFNNFKNGSSPEIIASAKASEAEAKVQAQTQVATVQSTGINSSSINNVLNIHSTKTIS